MVERIPMRDRVRIEDAMPLDIEAFSAHLILEEEILGPHMTSEEFARMISEHEYFKKNRKDYERWVKHGEWEKSIFSRISKQKAMVGRNYYRGRSLKR